MNRIEGFLKELSYNSKYQFLDYGSNQDELNAICAKRGIKLPAHDLAIFKCVYAFTDRMNINGCTLPKDEVETALDTLVGKAVNFDHLRKNVVGHWIDAKIEGDQIIAYGIFFKGNFSEDYELVKKLFESGNLAISFEAYGNREFKDAASYNLRDIEFSGGALLIKTQPAFPGSEVLEMAKKETRVLELAKIMIEPKEFLTGKDAEKTEEKKCGSDDMEDEKQCDMQDDMDEDDMDDMPAKQDPRWMGERLTYKQKKTLSDDMFAVVINKNGKKIRKYVINDENHVRNALARLGQEPSKEGLRRLGISVESVTRKVLKRARELDMKDLLARHNANVGDEDIKTINKEEVQMEELKKELEALKAEFANKVAELQKKEEELAKVKADLEKSSAVIEELKKESADAKGKIEVLEKETATKIEQAKAETAKLIARKTELAGIEMSDADLLDDGKYEMAKMKKMLAEKEAEIAKLKEGKEEPKKEEASKKDLVKGSKDKGTVEDAIKTKASLVQKFAWSGPVADDNDEDKDE